MRNKTHGVNAPSVVTWGRLPSELGDISRQWDELHARRESDDAELQKASQKAGRVFVYSPRWAQRVLATALALQLERDRDVLGVLPQPVAAPMLCAASQTASGWATRVASP